MVSPDTNPYESPAAQSQPKHTNRVAVAWRMVGFGGVGFSVGLLLTIGGVLAIETGGYGTPFFLLIFSAPSGLIPRGPLVLLSSVAFWILLWSLAGGLNRRAIRLALRLVLVIHYVSIPFVIAWGEIGGLTNFQEAVRVAGGWLAISIALYVFSHIYFWLLLLRDEKRG